MKLFRAAILEADGGAWRNTARLAIKAFLDVQLKDGKIPVLA